MFVDSFQPRKFFDIEDNYLKLSNLCARKINRPGDLVLLKLFIMKPGIRCASII